jgi:serine/threonine protein kinase/tetratricopeptide (TPR) repeat protein
MRFAHFQFDPKLDKLGEGPSSQVYRATDQRLGRPVALKILRPHVEFDPAATERFEREAKHTSHLAHPNIATVYEYGKDRGTSFIAMELLEGRTLDKRIKEGPVELDEGLKVALQVASALALVHERGLIHRDLKPANVMTLSSGRVKLLDFGICRSTAESDITQEGTLIGTVLYMSPEQVLGEELDFASDVFAFGAVFYHAFTGELPFPGKSFPEVCLSILEARPRAPSALRPGLPKSLEEFLLKCLARDRRQRYSHGGELHAALLAVERNVRLTSSAERPAAVEGHLWIPPFVVPADGPARDFASGVRRDLSSELERSTNLEVHLPDADNATGVPEDGFVLRGSLELSAGRAAVDYLLERAGRNGRKGRASTALLLRERVEHAERDEWDLQAKLVGALARSLRRRLADYEKAPPPEVRRDPARAENLARRAHEVLHRGTTRHLMAAIATFRHALAEDPSCTLAHAGLAEALVHKFVFWDGEVSFLQEARESAQRALSLAPFSAEGHTTLGFAHLVSGELDEAARELRLSIQIDHEEWLAHRLLGELLLRQGSPEAASPLLYRAIALRPTHIGSYDTLFAALRVLDRYEEALAVADRGMAAAKKHLVEVPDDQEARLALALLQARMRLHDDARRTTREARERSPKDAQTAYQAARVAALCGDKAEAIELLREARDRGFYLRSDARNPDFEALRNEAQFLELQD